MATASVGISDDHRPSPNTIFDRRMQCSIARRTSAPDAVSRPRSRSPLARRDKTPLMHGSCAPRLDDIRRVEPTSGTVGMLRAPPSSMLATRRSRGRIPPSLILAPRLYARSARRKPVPGLARARRPACAVREPSRGSAPRRRVFRARSELDRRRDPRAPGAERTAQDGNTWQVDCGGSDHVTSHLQSRLRMDSVAPLWGMT
jgi:hypothetical protein